MAKFTCDGESIQAKTLKGARAKILDLMNSFYKHGIPSHDWWSATINCDGTPIGEVRISADFFNGKARWIGIKRNPVTEKYQYTNMYFLNKDGSLGKFICNDI